MAQANPIPLVDLKAAHAEIAEEVAAGFERVLATTGFVGGPEVAAFEQEFAAFSGVRHCVGVANGTDAVELALRAAGVRRDDEVVLPANTFIATAGAVARLGAVPVLVDCDPDSYLIDVQAALAAVGPRTAAVLPVHLYGQHAAVEELTEKLAGTDVRVVEDAAQCQGATRNGRGAGVGGIAATSFYPGKNLGAYGDGGAVVTDDPQLARQVRALANHGGLTKYSHDMVGFNSRLDALQAVVLRAKLRRLPQWNAARRAAAVRYAELLDDVPGIVLPPTLEGNEHVWHLYVVRVEAFDGDRVRRDALVSALNAQGIGAGVHYPAALHLTPAFAHLGYPEGAFPHAEAAAARLISLPLHPHVTEAQQRRVAEALATALG
ncbi:DegT/DnrJ/EryC1/StrS family aminotransferase [Actinocrinis puniceicyclus]|uniref:DegT/DnrJ/EryC1/StrS family aminotransferase n=1 Tax=Actinocrinis puniceicyclus TaxID=977794 RepID=A0A8J7WSR3_9ACTN|nr:DegT/DnrJ/EryC1/StrS family aminotransferase [Actinocrinis puniceicyclus]MBS2966095.1 DegT/DnrJ/EryC1/StrS family aminotransferase [Actinocrinis puniceicyclus]